MAHLERMALEAGVAFWKAIELPDGTVPSNTAEALECWHRVAQDSHNQIAELKREIAKPRTDFLTQLRQANTTRAARWHPGGLDDWSILEWAGCMAGEAGEAANVAKKIRRGETGAQGRNHPSDLRSALAKELADTIIYADLVAAKAGIDLRGAIAATFNQKSEEYGFPERIEAGRL